jgi:cell division protease FtsH
MKFSWKTALLWTLPALLVGVFVWQAFFASVPAAESGVRNTANSRMTYGRFLEYLEAGKIQKVDLFDGGRTAIVETNADLEIPGLGSRIQRARVDLPGSTPQFITQLRESKIDLDVHPIRNNGAILGLIGNLIFPVFLITGLFF